MSKIMDAIIKYHLPEFIPSVIGYGVLGGRICYSSKSVQELLNSDEKLNNVDMLLDFVKRLISNGHMSVFEHCVIPLTYDDISTLFTNNISLQDIVSEISPDFAYLFELIDSQLYQKFPIYGHEKELKGLFTGIVLVLKSKFHVLPYTENVVLLNLRHVLEYKYKQLKSWGSVAEWFIETFGSTIKKRYKFDLQPVLVESINNKQSTLYILRLYYDKKVVGVTYILEGVSRVLTHQLVRHRLFCSYSQRSHRHTKVGEDEFVFPPLDYITPKVVRTKVTKVFSNAYKNSLEFYKKLVEEGVQHKDNTVKVHKEDARFVIPDGVKTTVMVTMLTDGFFNFLHERTDSSAQWEIREVAQALKKSL